MPNSNCNAAVAAIKFALEETSCAPEDGMEFLRSWFNGEFDICRDEWPKAPDECYIGADPLFKPRER